MAPDLRATEHHQAAVGHLAKAGRALELHQIERPGPLRGNVSSWPSRQEEDFHGTLMAIWIWARHEALTSERRFVENRELAWRYVLEAGVRFLPEELPPDAYEAPFDAACLLLAAIADQQAGSEPSRQAMAELGSEALRRHITTLGGEGGREFRDPGFLVWALGEYGRAFNEDRAFRAAHNYVEHFFGIESPPAPAHEPSPEGALFDFFSTTATRVLASLATQGDSPFSRLWLKERVLPVLPTEFISRPLDENAWNAWVGSMMGRAYAHTHDAAFLERYFAVVGELSNRDLDRDGALGRDASFQESETLPTWAWAMAMTALEGG